MLIYDIASNLNSISKTNKKEFYIIEFLLNFIIVYTNHLTQFVLKVKD